MFKNLFSKFKETRIKDLSLKEFRATFGKEMIDVTLTGEASVDIWPYVQKLVSVNKILPEVYERELVEKVYRSNDKTYDHVLLPTTNKNIFIVIVVDRDRLKIYGHSTLDLNKEYGLS